jgi:tRNA(Met) cytidine acetyltransferase
MTDTNSLTTPSNDALSSWLLKLSTLLEQSQQRQVLSLRGDISWCVNSLSAIDTVYRDVVIVSDRLSDPRSVALKRVDTLLGSETSLVIVDLFDGINPDLLCIASGLIRCGGLLVILSPEIEQWSLVEDRFGVWQDNAKSVKPVFVEYLFNSIEKMPASGYTVYQGKALPELIDLPVAEPTALASGKTPEQGRLLTEIDNWLLDSRQSIAVIEADRGRGKSTALGFIVNRLIEERKNSVIVTAHSRQAAAILLQQADSNVETNRDYQFVAPDRLIVERIPADVLVIDEAAMLPHTMLKQLCGQYARVIMATTIGGYEGTGQGFLLRFIERLPSERLSRFKLSAPVRWAVGDCLESWLNKTLFLKPPSNLCAPDDLTAASFDCRVVSGEDLGKDLVLLEKLYALLVSAHYRTRPSDLRMLLENPDLVVILAESNEFLVGVVLLNQEGGLSADVCEQVYLGKRRPKGHLLAQMITAQAGDRNFGRYRGMRIQRIAVEQDWRRSGVGSDLIAAAIRVSREQNCDYLGASYAFDPETTGFWNSCEFLPVHVGFAAGKSSANQSVAVLRSLNPKVDNNIQALQARIQKQLPLWLCQFLQYMDVDSVAALLACCRFKADLTDMERGEIDAFVHGHKGFELCFASLQGFVMQSIADAWGSRMFHPWLIEKAVQNQEWSRLQTFPPLAGRKQIQQKLRELIGDLTMEGQGENHREG